MHSGTAAAPQVRPGRRPMTHPGTAAHPSRNAPMTLPAPQVAACYFDVGFVPPLAAMQLVWPQTIPPQTGWLLPNGETLPGGPPPIRFGLRIRRQAEDAYAVTLLWDSTYRQWYSLRRRELLGSS